MTANAYIYWVYRDIRVSKTAFETAPEKVKITVFGNSSLTKNVNFAGIEIKVEAFDRSPHFRRAYSGGSKRMERHFYAAPF
jgi:hypothetical protein